MGDGCGAGQIGRNVPPSPPLSPKGLVPSGGIQLAGQNGTTSNGGHKAMKNHEGTRMRTASVVFIQCVLGWHIRFNARMILYRRTGLCYAFPRSPWRGASRWLQVHGNGGKVSFP